MKFGIWCGGVASRDWSIKSKWPRVEGVSAVVENCVTDGFGLGGCEDEEEKKRRVGFLKGAVVKSCNADGLGLDGGR